MVKINNFYKLNQISILLTTILSKIKSNFIIKAKKIIVEIKIKLKSKFKIKVK